MNAPAPKAEPKATPPLVEPPHGGSWHRNPITGELTPAAPPPQEPAAQAAPEK